MQSITPDLPPVIQRLRSFHKDNSNAKRNYPKGSKKPISRQLVQRFCDLIATSTSSIPQLLADNPDLPTFKTLESWKFRYPWVAQLWSDARKRQADFLIQHCLELAHNACPKTAHVVRVQFDIYKFVAAKFHPDLYGDKSFQPSQTTVNVGLSIAPERLNELRSKLSVSRTASLPLSNGEKHPSTSHDESPTRLTNGSESTRRQRAIPDVATNNDQLDQSQ